MWIVVIWQFYEKSDIFGGKYSWDVNGDVLIVKAVWKRSENNLKSVFMLFKHKMFGKICGVYMKVIIDSGKWIKVVDLGWGR